jgi:hypothetical protein
VKRSGGKGMEKRKKTESAVVGALGCDWKKRTEEVMAGDVGWVV